MVNDRIHMNLYVPHRIIMIKNKIKIPVSNIDETFI